jgi:adenylate kinase
VRRLSGRRVCRSCGAIYHVDNVPPKVENVCDRCGGELFVRDDDKIDAIRKRLDVYRKQTEPLIAYYRERDILYDIDSSRSAGHSEAQIDTILDEIESQNG